MFVCEVAQSLLNSIRISSAACTLFILDWRQVLKVLLITTSSTYWTSACVPMC